MTVRVLCPNLSIGLRKRKGVVLKQVAMGIDLGTSNSCVSVIQHEETCGGTNEWGEVIHASVVSFMDDNSVMVGNDAKRQIITQAQQTVSSTKRLIGRFYFSDEVKKAKALMPFPLVEGPSNTVRISMRQQLLSLPEISAMILKELRQIAESFVGHPVTKAVITVPAFFNDAQRQATKDAGRIAGLDVMRILNEPTAAALAYGFGQNMNQKVAIYDLGGGTFDVSILEIGSDIFEVLATSGDTYLGGDDFDQKIIDHIKSIFEKETGLDVSSDLNAMQAIKEAAENAKKHLSTDTMANIHIPAFLEDANGEAQSLQLNLSRDEFDKMVMGLLQRTFKVCDEAMSTAQLTAADIDGVIMVGGPTRLPIVRNAVRHFFQREPNVNIDPDLVVAMGAAIQADALLDSSTATFLLDVTPQTLRLGTVGDFTEPVIEKNTSIPIDRTRAFVTASDLQESVKIKVYQGENRLASECQLLGEFSFSGFKLAKRGDVKIEVTFDDADGIVQVSAVDVETGSQASTTISLSSGLDEQEIIAATRRNADLQLSSDGAATGLLPME